MWKVISPTSREDWFIGFDKPNSIPALQKDTTMQQTPPSRRDFLATTGVAAAGVGLAGLTASAAVRKLGANERLSVGIVGPGGRGRGVLKTFFDERVEGKADLTAVCDLWTRNRERGSALVKEATGKEPRQFKRLE